MRYENTEATKYVQVNRSEGVTLSITPNYDELTTTEFFELVGELYESLGYSNKVVVKINGLGPKMKDKLKYNPITMWELHIDDDEWSEEFE